MILRNIHLARLLTIVLLALSTAAATRAADPKWYRGNIHTHSLWSDGDDFPEMIADWYRQHGYNFLALSDHNVLSEGVRWKKHADILAKGNTDALEKYRVRFGNDWVETRGTPGMPDFEVRLRPLAEFRKLVEKPSQFLMVQCEEISDHVDNIPVHMNATNIKEAIEPQGGKSVAEAIDNNLRAAEESAKRNGTETLIHLNHPNFHYAVTAEDIAQVIRERFMEVYNGHPGVNHEGDKQHASVEQIWDIANTLRISKFNAPPLFGVATDDSHVYNGKPGSHPGRGWIMVRAEKLEPDTLVKAIKAGDMYASSGVSLKSVEFDAGKKRLHIEIEPVEGAKYTTKFIGTTVGFNAESKPRLDKEGKPARTTRKYSHDVGRVLATVEGTSPTYEFKGDELYVRAVVNSDQPPTDPSFKKQVQQAWTQPAGWEEQLKKAEDAEKKSAGGK